MDEGTRSTVSELLHEYLRARDAERGAARPRSPDSSGSPGADLEALAARAGADAEELRRRVADYEAFELLAERHFPSQGLARPEVLGGRFAIQGLIDSGGSGSVYRALDRELRREVAVKVLEANRLSGRPRAWALKESRSLARLEHPGVVRVLDVDEDGERVYIVMELLEGPSLAEVIAVLREDPADSRESEEPAGERRSAERAEAVETARRLEGPGARLQCLIDLARALAFCHERGVLHRDVKPQNVIFGADAAPRLIDFGLAHLDETDEETDTSTTVSLRGTPAYMAPEQVEAGRTGAAPSSEVFSFGVLCYELMTLTHPFQRDTRSATLDAVSMARPVPPRRIEPRISPALERVLLRALDRDPRERYPDPAAFAADLAAVRDDRPISVEPPSSVRRATLWARRNRRRLSIALAVLAVVVAALAAQAATAAFERRREILAAVEALEPAALRGAFEFQEALGVLDVQADAARRFDARFLPRTLFGAASPAVTECVREVSDALQHAIAGAPDNPLWNASVMFVARLCPQCPDPHDMRRRGFVEVRGVPAGWELAAYRQVPIGNRQLELAIRILTPLDVSFAPGEEPGSFKLRDYPALGSYRIACWDPRDPAESLREVAFVRSDEWPAFLALTMRAPTTAPLAWRRVPARELRLEVPEPMAAEGKHTLFVPGFDTTGLITWAQVEEYRRATGAGNGSGDENIPVMEAAVQGAPARLTWDQASEMARWAGGRLPLPGEIVACFELAPPPADAAGEWSAGVGLRPVPGMVPYIEYAELARDSMRAWSRSPLAPRQTATVAGNDRTVAFRIVRSRATPDELARARAWVAR